MCRAGFIFQYGGLTILEEALDWLKLNPGFRVANVYNEKINPSKEKLPASID